MTIVFDGIIEDSLEIVNEVSESLMALALIGLNLRNQGKIFGLRP